MKGPIRPGGLGSGMMGQPAVPMQTVRAMRCGTRGPGSPLGESLSQREIYRWNRLSVFVIHCTKRKPRRRLAKSSSSGWTPLVFRGQAPAPERPVPRHRIQPMAGRFLFARSWAAGDRANGRVPKAATLRRCIGVLRAAGYAFRLGSRMLVGQPSIVFDWQGLLSWAYFAHAPPRDEVRPSRRLLHSKRCCV